MPADSAECWHLHMQFVLTSDLDAAACHRQIWCASKPLRIPKEQKCLKCLVINVIFVAVQKLKIMLCIIIGNDTFSPSANDITLSSLTIATFLTQQVTAIPFVKALSWFSSVKPTGTLEIISLKIGRVPWN